MHTSRYTASPLGHKHACDLPAAEAYYLPYLLLSSMKFESDLMRLAALLRAVFEQQKKFGRRSKEVW